MTSTCSFRDVLDVHPERNGFTCVGTSQKGLRCGQKYLCHAHLAEASQILDSLPHPEQFRTHSAEIFPLLRNLAWLTLCPRWHQNDRADAVAAKWMRTIQGLPRTNVSIRVANREVSTPVSLLTSTSSTRNTGHSTPAQLPNPPQSPISTAHQRRAARTEHSNTNRSRPVESLSASEQASLRTESERGTNRLNLNIELNLGQPERFRITNSDSTGTSFTATSTTLAAEDVETRLTRIEVLLEELIHAQTSHQSTRFPRSSMQRSSTAISTRDLSIISSLNLGEVLEAADHFWSPPRTPPPRPHRGSLSISSDSDIPSLTTDADTPTSSRSPTPFLRSPAPEPSSISRRSTQSRRGSLEAAPTQRRPLGPCYICYEQTERSDDAVWCRSSCGQNVCNECFELWRRSQEGVRELRCGFWYVMLSLLMRGFLTFRQSSTVGRLTLLSCILLGIWLSFHYFLRTFFLESPTTVLDFCPLPFVVHVKYTKS